MYKLLQDELSNIVADGAFGKNVKLVSFEQDSNQAMQYQFMSSLIFGTITTSDKLAYQIVIKLKPRDEKLREKCNIDAQFHNEVTMYQKVVPFLWSSSTARDDSNVPSLPRFFYGRNIGGKFAENDLIVLENVRPQGFRPCQDPIFLDYDHLLSAIQTLAKFHALSYTAKHKDPAGFREIIADIRDTQFHPKTSWLFQGDTLWRYAKRGIDRLLERCGDLYRDHENLRRFIELFADTENSIRRALRPREPLSVVCPGDFNRNNLMFRYDNTGKPIDTLLLDFGTPRYGSPALDLSFFLYMSTTQTMRRERWDDLLDAYCATVAASVPSGVRTPDRTELDSEMAASAFFGLAHVLFFLPFLTSGGLSEGPEVGWNPWYVQCGGDAESEYVADLVQHFVDMAYTNV